MWNIAAVIPVEKGLNIGTGGTINNGGSTTSDSGELASEENFLGMCSRELLARGSELLKRTRDGNFLFLSSHKYLVNTEDLSQSNCGDYR